MNHVNLYIEPLHDNRQLSLAPPAIPEFNFSPAQWGMLSFLVSEVAFFSTLIVVYLSFLGADQSGPTPSILSVPLVICTTLCLIASSATVHLATKSQNLGNRADFLKWWSASIVLGVVFLAGTAYEWRELITVQHLTISRNLFGSTYYTLVGFHALHVSAGVVVMLAVLAMTLSRILTSESKAAVELVSWYWHFVDGVWIVVFALVYLAGR
jgi:cytochrome c oxidase subunit 3/cytochrome o ubiquinol oxidase subunit 3